MPVPAAVPLEVWPAISTTPLAWAAVTLVDAAAP